MKGPIVLMGAMAGEISAFKGSMTLTDRTEWSGHIFHEGRLAERDILLVKSGVGKVLSSMVTQKVIDRYRPEALIFTGIAGSLRENLLPGDMVAGKDSVQHDFDSTRFGFKRGEIPYSGFRFIESDMSLLKAALSFTPPEGKLRQGRIVTGDQFISERDSPEMAYLTSELEGDCVDMEGASVALVSHVNRVPHLLVRTISDMADGGSKVNLREMLRKSSANSLGLVLHILKMI